MHSQTAGQFRPLVGRRARLDDRRGLGRCRWFCDWLGGVAVGSATVVQCESQQPALDRPVEYTESSPRPQTDLHSRVEIPREKQHLMPRPGVFEHAAQAAIEVLDVGHFKPLIVGRIAHQPAGFARRLDVRKVRHIKDDIGRHAGSWALCLASSSTLASMSESSGSYLRRLAVRPRASLHEPLVQRSVVASPSHVSEIVSNQTRRDPPHSRAASIRMVPDSAHKIDQRRR